MPAREMPGSRSSAPEMLLAATPIAVAPLPSCIYTGRVVHKRLRPKPHAMSYDVFWLFLDLDRLEDTAQRLRSFSANKRNVVSFHERDHGARTSRTDSSRPPSLAAQARAAFAAHGLERACATIYLLSFPRILGYAFNPISVYYGYDTDGQLAGAIYEVSNTFGERHSYVTPISQVAMPDASRGSLVHAHGCTKQLYVSPFTDIVGQYSFRLTEPTETLTLGVLLRDPNGPLLKTHFTATAQPLTDRALATLLLKLPLMTAKVTAGIHFEAAKLWLKGVPLTTKPAARPYATTAVDEQPVSVPKAATFTPSLTGRVNRTPSETATPLHYAEDRG